MSPERHKSDGRRLRPDPRLEANLVVRSLALRLPAGQRIDSHDHPWPQLIYAVRGVMTVEAGSKAWVVPPQRAIWMAPGVEHAIENPSPLWLRTLYLHPRYGALRPATCSVLQVSSLLRALILEIVEMGQLDRRRRDQARLAGVLMDRLRQADEVPVDLPLPRDPRARRVADRVRADPAGQEPLAELASDCGATPRTVERIFQREVAMTFGSWRRQARLAHALGLLAEGEAVTQVALAVGYDSTSAFVAMFKRELGTTPGRYFRASGGAPPQTNQRSKEDLPLSRGRERGPGG